MTITGFDQVSSFFQDKNKFYALKELAKQENEELKLCDKPGCQQIYVTNERHKKDFCIECSGDLRSLRMSERSKAYYWKNKKEWKEKYKDRKH